MKTFATKEKQSAPAVRKARPYVHHPMGPVQLAQQAEVCRILRSTGAQAKLTIGQPNDKYEQEADRVADQVMAMPDSKLQRQPENEEEDETIQTKSLADQITPLVQRQEESPEEVEVDELAQTKPLGAHVFSSSKTPIQPKGAGAQIPQVPTAVAANIQALKGGGSPLPQNTRAFFEPRFGADFSQVRVHTDSRAAATTNAIQAKAFTIGKNIAFGTGRYAPRSHQGRKLLAHELTHVVQQNTLLRKEAGVVQRWSLRGQFARIGRAKSIRNLGENFAKALSSRPLSSPSNAAHAARALHNLANKIAQPMMRVLLLKTVFSYMKLTVRDVINLIMAWPVRRQRAQLFITALKGRYRVRSVVGAWEIVGLKRLFAVLGKVWKAKAHAHLIGLNFEGIRLGQPKASKGQYTKNKNQVTIWYHPATVAARTFTMGFTTPLGRLPRRRSAGYARLRDLLARANVFDETVLHEIGHAIDHKLNIMKRFGDNTKFGKWRSYPACDYSDVLLDMVSSKHAVTTAFKMRKVLKRLMEKKKPTNNDVYLAVKYAETSRHRPGPLAPPRRRSVRTRPHRSAFARHMRRVYRSYMHSRLVKIALTCRVFNRPWKWGLGRLAMYCIDGYVYHEGSWSAPSTGGSCGGGFWYRYSLAQRRQQVRRRQKLSDYQWRSPGDWFAELYAAYYLKLLPRNHPLRRWFKRSIHQNKTLNPRNVLSP